MSSEWTTTGFGNQRGRIDRKADETLADRANGGVRPINLYREDGDDDDD